MWHVSCSHFAHIADLFFYVYFQFICVLGGGLLIAEKFLNEDKTGPKSTLLQSLNMLVQLHGKERTATEYKELLEKQGFVGVQTKELESSSELDAILCRKA